MLGWNISVYRKARGRSRPATEHSAPGERLAVWQSGASGLGWLDELPPGDARLLAVDGGYPTRYTARASAVLPVLRAGPPAARSAWHVGEHATIVDRARWPGRTVVDDASLDRCDPDEWLLVEAWDES